MEELPTQSIYVKRLEIAILPLGFPYSELMIHSGEILITGKFTRRSFAFFVNEREMFGTLLARLS